jgi:splicing factor 1
MQLKEQSSNSERVTELTKIFFACGYVIGAFKSPPHFSSPFVPPKSIHTYIILFIIVFNTNMSWRNKGAITGTNNIPLGPRKRLGEEDVSRSESPADYINNTPAGPLKLEDRQGARSRKRKSRWGPETSSKENKILGLMGMSTALTAIMTPEQVEAYALALRIEEITQKMKINDVVPPFRERSRSPPPTYDNMGRRTNTREVRYRKKLEDERHRLVEKAMRFIPEFKPPSDYRRLTRTQEKIYIPVNDVLPFLHFPNLSSIRKLTLVLTSLSPFSFLLNVY